MREMTPEGVLEQLSILMSHGRKLETSLKKLHDLDADERAEAVTKMHRLTRVLVGAAEEIATAARRLR
jgi:hypothetical protein